MGGRICLPWPGLTSGSLNSSRPRETNSSPQNSLPWPGLTSGSLNSSFMFLFCRPTPKTQSAHERALKVVSGVDFKRIPHYFSKRVRSRGPRGPPWPRRAENRPGIPGRIYLLSSLRSAQMAIGATFSSAVREPPPTRRRRARCAAVRRLPQRRRDPRRPRYPGVPRDPIPGATDFQTPALVSGGCPRPRFRFLPTECGPRRPAAGKASRTNGQSRQHGGAPAKI